MSGLDIEDVSFSYGARMALDHLSFSVHQGDFCALLGPNGAGKSTLFALMSRLFTTRQGRILVKGHDISRAPRQALAEIGVVFQPQTLDLDLTVYRNLAYYAALHGLSGREARHRIDAALERLAMRGRAGERVRELNGGHRRRAEIARALVHRPSVLLLDEPTVGLDHGARMSIIAHVHDLCAEDELTVLWATHLTDEVRSEDRLVILHRGRLLAEGTASSVTGTRPLSEVFLEMTGEPT